MGIGGCFLLLLRSAALHGHPWQRSVGQFTQIASWSTGSADVSSTCMNGGVGAGAIFHSMSGLVALHGTRYMSTHSCGTEAEAAAACRPRLATRAAIIIYRRHADSSCCRHTRVQPYAHL